MSNDNLSSWKKFYKINNSYHIELEKFALNKIPKGVSVIEFGCKGGELLSKLPNKLKVGVDQDLDILNYARKNNPKTQFVEEKEVFKKFKKSKFDYVLLSDVLSKEKDVQLFLKKVKTILGNDGRVVVTYFNYFWKLLLDLAKYAGLMLSQLGEPNWLTQSDTDNIFELESYEKIKSGKMFLFPFELPLISDFINRYIAPLPLINKLCLSNYAIYKPKTVSISKSVSIIIPARNEAGNMKGVLKQIPRFGTKTEVVFVEGHSKDDTFKTIKEEIKKYKGPIKASVYKQKGAGKGDAVRLGFYKAKNEILMILDADLTVDPKELPKFYEAMIKGSGELVMGSRLIYPMEKLAMRELNTLGNKFFSLVFSFLLGQKIKDTLCGTKVLSKENYEKIAKNRKIFGDFDPFGDFDLIFGAAKLNFKILEIPIRYKQRTYGETNISRFKHGLLLFRMVFFAASKIKFV